MKLKDKILGLFSKALDEAKLDDAPGDDAEAKAKAEAEAAAKAKAGDAAALDARMTKIEEMLAQVADKLDPEAAAAKAKAADEAKKAEDEAAAAKKKAEDEAAAAKAKDAEGGDDPMAKRLATIEAALAKLLGLEEEEKQQREAGDGGMCKDAEVIARAEILAPGIAKTADVKVKALDAAYATEDGKTIIDLLLAGKTLETADKDTLFVAASEMLKGTRRSQFQSQVSLDSLPGMKAGEMTPEKINAMNAERYGKK